MMLGSVAIVFAVLTQFAGRWGVPYFDFTTERGSTCTNDWTGYTCDPLTVSDVNWWASTTLPADSTVRSARYVSTHDYTLTATVDVPERQAAATLTTLEEQFGSCVEDHPAPMSTAGLKSVCVMADALAEANSTDSSKSSRLYSVGTGLRADGTRIVVLDIRSR